MTSKYRRALEVKMNTILAMERTFKPLSRVVHARPENNLQGRRNGENGRWHPEETSVLLRMVLNWNRENVRLCREDEPGDFAFDSYLKWDWVQEACRGRSYELPAKELAWFQFMVKYRTLPAMRSHLKSIQGNAIRVEWEHATAHEERCRQQ